MATFRIASFNVENPFERPRAMAFSDWDLGRPILERHARVNDLLNQPASAAYKAEIATLLTELGLNGSDEGGLYARLRQIRGRLVSRPPGQPIEIVASGRVERDSMADLRLDEVAVHAASDHAAILRGQRL